jgi:L-malate glycosyltransferase
VLALYRLLRAERPHVLHTHRWGTLFEGLVAARMAGVPFVVHGEHGTMETRPRNLRPQRWAWNRADAVLSVSSRLAERLSREVSFPPERIRTIRNGLDVGRFVAADAAVGRSRLNIGPDDLVIGTVGRLVPVKAQHVLIDALAILREQGLAFKAVLVGGGPLRGELEAQGRARGLADCLHFTGTQPEVEHLVAAFDIFVLSSSSEGLSNVIQEAMAARRPVVATAVGGSDELVCHDETGLLVPPGSPTELASAILRLAQSPELRDRMGRKGQERAREEFGIDRMIREYENVYVGLAAQRPELFNAVETCKA